MRPVDMLPGTPDVPGSRNNPSQCVLNACKKSEPNIRGCDAEVSISKQERRDGKRICRTGIKRQSGDGGGTDTGRSDPGDYRDC